MSCNWTTECWTSSALLTWVYFWGDLAWPTSRVWCGHFLAIYLWFLHHMPIRHEQSSWNSSLFSFRIQIRKSKCIFSHPFNPSRTSSPPCSGFTSVVPKINKTSPPGCSDLGWEPGSIFLSMSNSVVNQRVNSQKHLLQILRPVHLRWQAFQWLNKLPPVGVNLSHARQAAPHHVEAVTHAGLWLG